MMREQQLAKRSKTLQTLDEAVTAMKSLSAHHFLLARRSLQTARQYRSEIDELILQFGLHQKDHRTGPPGVLLVSSDLGLCGDFNSRLARFAVDYLDQHPGSLFYVVGRRGRMAMAKKSVACERVYTAPASVDGLPPGVLSIASDIVKQYAQQKIASLTVVSARFEGAGRFTATSTQLLPIVTRSDRPAVATPYQSRQHLLEVAVREYLYITIYELLLDSLAAEHGMRLIAAESARKWIDDTHQDVQRQLAAVRRENSTQEVLDIVAGSRKVKKQKR
jgi:F-type H+-transporting ATPase subunit gamma